MLPVRLIARYSFALTLAASWTGVACAQVPYLVKDINGQVGEAEIDWFVPVSDRLFFAVQRDGNFELWKSDGSSGGTVLVHKLCTGYCDRPLQVLGAGGLLYFTFNDRLTGAELWRSDGTAEGTLLVRDIQPGTGSSWPETFMDVSGTLFFRADDGETGVELWKSDGTEAGTVMVKDLEPGPSSSYPHLTLASGDSLYVGTASSEVGAALWRSDGTEAGTVELDIFPPETVWPPNIMVEVSGLLYFVQEDVLAGRELWRSDGTAAGTWRVRDINPGFASSEPQGLVAMGETLLFTAVDADFGRELWRSDGTEAGTVRVKDLCPGPCSSVAGEAKLLPDGTYLFVARDGAFSGPELWKSDGSETGTTLVADIWPGEMSSEPERFLPLAGELLFLADDGVHGTELWRTDGTPAGTALYRDFCPGDCFGFHRDHYKLATLGDTLMLSFFAMEAFVFPRGQLWRSDGSDAGTTLVMEIREEVTTFDSHPSHLSELGDILVFSADDGLAGQELWRSDGSEAGTYLLRDIEPGAVGSTPSGLVVVSGELFFDTWTVAHGRELWRSDGSEAGTMLVRDICPGPCDGLAAGSASALTAVGEVAYFAADDGASGLELWRTDGTEPGTLRVSDVALGPSGANPKALVAVGDALFFRASDGVSGEELWKTDGTEIGTGLVADLCPGSCTPYRDFPGSEGTEEAVGSTLYFVAGTLEQGFELWKSDGTAAGTVLVKDIVLGPGSPVLEYLTDLGGTLLFLSDDDALGLELWRGDGTEVGTVPITEISEPEWYAPAHELTVIGDEVFFEAAPYGAIHWLRASDGSVAGTRIVKTLESEIDFPMNIGGILVFMAKDGGDDALWRSDGTEAGTMRVTFFPDGRGPSSLAHARGQFFFPHDEDDTGWELWAIGPSAGSVLLRNDSVTALAPITPPLAAIFPLDPGRDGIGSLPPGALDPDTGIVSDRTRPLVFYSLAGAETLRLVKADALRIRIEY